jgi:glycosyltransferase involved in cell wall biosynthesis
MMLDKKHDTVLLTTIFPASNQYLDDFFTSLQKQTYRNFDIIVVNDGVKDFNSFKIRYADLNIIEIISEQSPAKNREKGINEILKHNYDYIVFGDSDDYFSENRLENSVKALKVHDIVLNEINLLYENELIVNFFANNLKQLDKLQENIFESNIFGFSNMAVRTEIIESPVNFNTSLIAVDWYFITTLFLSRPVTVQFLKDAKTFYRQHKNNKIGMSELLNEKKLDLGLKVKQLHYTGLMEYCQKSHKTKYLVVFKNKLEQIQKLIEHLTNPDFKEKYIYVINQNRKLLFSGWWSEILTLEDYNKYENSNK